MMLNKKRIHSKVDVQVRLDSGSQQKKRKLEGLPPAVRSGGHGEEDMSPAAIQLPTDPTSQAFKCLVGRVAQKLALRFLQTDDVFAFEINEQGNADLHVVPSTADDPTITPGLRVQIKGSLISSVGMSTERDRLHHYQGMLLIFVRISDTCFRNVGRQVLNGEVIRITLEALQSCEFYFVPVSRVGTFSAGSPAVALQSAPGSPDFPTLTEPAVIQIGYRISDQAEESRAMFQRHFRPFLASTTSEESRIECVRKHMANRFGCYDFWPLDESERQNGSQLSFQEQRNFKVLQELFMSMGMTLDGCREGATCDALLCGTIRVEFKSGNSNGNMDFGRPKQLRVNPPSGRATDREVDLVMQPGEWKIDASGNLLPSSMTIVAIPHQAFTNVKVHWTANDQDKDDPDSTSAANGKRWPSVRCTSGTIDRPSCDLYRLDLTSPNFLASLNRVICASREGREQCTPRLDAVIPWYSWLRSAGYRKRWLGLTHNDTRLSLPEELPILIRRALLQRPFPLPIPSRWPEHWKVEWEVSTSIVGRPGARTGHPIIGQCASLFRCLWSEACCADPHLEPCEGKHRSAPKHQACLKRHGVSQYSLYLHGTNLKTPAQKEIGVCRYVDSQGAIVFV
jgi:hypothetical protein